MAKRRLSNFNFEAEGSHIALVHKDQGGPANGYDYALVQKATNDIKEKDIEKAAEVTVTMSMVDFLCKFFGLWYEDAIVLAAIFGYQDIDEAYSFQESADAYEEYLQERVDAVQIMKALVLDKSLDEIKKSVGELSPKDYLEVLKVQEQFEKNFDEASAKVASVKKSSAKEGVTVSKETISPSVEISKQEEDSMSEFISKSAHEEAVSKAVEDAIQKALAPVQEQLQKAQEQLAEVEKAKKAQVEKARKDAIAEVEKDAEKAEALFKASEALSDEAFDVIVKSLKAKEEQLSSSDLFVQKSKNADMDQKKDEENGTLALLKKKYAQQ